jgi:hydrogenase expression/formation protein HypE
MEAKDTMIKLLHGSGRGLADLLDQIILPALLPNSVGPLEDAAIIQVKNNRLAFTTDSFVVSPLEFKGGDIGKLAACGTINDLAMMGAIPKWMSVALILEEGLSIARLRSILVSLRKECEQAKVSLVCGDTKVVESGKADGMFITTSGIGQIPEGRSISAMNARKGDMVLLSGSIGLHGIAILAARKGLGFASSAVSDCAALNEIVDVLLHAVPEVKVMRDATRGGVAAVLNEIAKTSKVTIFLEDEKIPVPEVVRGACNFLGMDPISIANEGRFVAIVPNHKAMDALKAMQSHPLGQGASIIGTVVSKERFPVLIKTAIGGIRPVEVPAGELLPRIC